MRKICFNIIVSFLFSQNTFAFDKEVTQEIVSLITNWSKEIRLDGFMYESEILFLNSIYGIAVRESLSMNGQHYQIDSTKLKQSYFRVEENIVLRLNFPKNISTGVQGGLLGIARFYFVATRLYPYREQIEEEIKSHLKRVVQAVLNSKNNLDIHIALLKYTALLKDSHGSILSNLSGSTSLMKHLKLEAYKPPLKMEFDANHFYVNTFDTVSHEVIRNNAVVKINFTPINVLFDSLTQFINASSQVGLRRDFCKLVLCSDKDESFELELMDGSIITTKATLTSNEWYKLAYPASKLSHSMLSEKVYYVNFSKFKKKRRIQAFLNKIENNDTLIIDLTQGGSDLEDEWIKMLATKKGVFAKSSNLVDGLETMEYDSVIINNISLKSPTIFLLINENTQSNTEWVAMKFFTYIDDVEAIGKPTSGANGDVCYLYLFEDFFTFLSGVNIAWANGAPVQRVGIIPTINILFNDNNMLEKIRSNTINN